MYEKRQHVWQAQIMIAATRDMLRCRKACELIRVLSKRVQTVYVEM